MPTCVAASPTPRASCISWRMRAASAFRSSSNDVTSCARIRSTGSPYCLICASASCRRACASASSSASSMTWPSTSSSTAPLRLDARRVDVHYGGEPVAVHRRSRGREQSRGRRGHRTRPVGLRDELCAEPTAQTKEWRRAEHLAGQTRLHFRERALGETGLRACDDDADEVPVGRIAELAAPLELARQEARDVMTRRELDRACVRLERLDENASRRIATAPAGELRQQLKGSLLGAEVRQPETRVGVDDRRERDAGEVVPLRHHL